MVCKCNKLIACHLQEATRPSIPILLAVGAVHQHLIQNGLRMSTSIVADTAQCFSTHQFACLIGYGARLILRHKLLSVFVSTPFCFRFQLLFTRSLCALERIDPCSFVLSVWHIELISSDIKLIRTDSELNLSQKAEKCIVQSVWHTTHFIYDLSLNLLD